MTGSGPAGDGALPWPDKRMRQSVLRASRIRRPFAVGDTLPRGNGPAAASANAVLDQSIGHMSYQ
eukprot:gene45832-biopygen37023